MNRRKFLATTGVAATTVVAGCMGTNTSSFKLLDLGVTERGNSAASYVTVKNVGGSRLIRSDGRVPQFALAAYDEDGVRVSDWNRVRGDRVAISEERSVFNVWDTNSGWFDSNNLGQVNKLFNTRVRAVDGNNSATGPELTEEHIGMNFDKV